MRSTILVQLAFAVVAIAFWELATTLNLVDPTLLPPFTKVAAIIIGFLGNASFLSDLGVSASEVMVSILIAAPLAVGLGFFLGEQPRLAAYFNPVFYLALAIPQSIFLPIFVLAFGNGFYEKVIFGVTHAFFVIALNAFAAVRSVPTQFVVVARSFGANRRQIYSRIYAPAMLPLVINGLRLGLIFAIIGVILAEMYASKHGIGQRLFGWGEAYKVPELIAGVLLISVMTVILNELMRCIEFRFTRGAERS